MCMKDTDHCEMLILSKAILLLNQRILKKGTKTLENKLPLEPTPEDLSEPEVTIEPIKATKTKTMRKISLLKLRGEILNEIKNEEKRYK